MLKYAAEGPYGQLAKMVVEASRKSYEPVELRKH